MIVDRSLAHRVSDKQDGCRHFETKLQAGFARGAGETINLPATSEFGGEFFVLASRTGTHPRTFESELVRTDAIYLRRSSQPLASLRLLWPRAEASVSRSHRRSSPTLWARSSSSG